MELQVGVKILLQNNEGKYLVIHRSATKYPEVKEPWDIVGGRITPGTPLLENLQREVTEETQLTIVGEPRLVAAQDILRVPGRHVVRLTYVGQTEGELVLDTEENDEHQWLTVEELKNLSGFDQYAHALLVAGKLQ